MMITSIEKFINSLSWRTLFFLNPAAKPKTKKETYDFKSQNNPPSLDELQPFKEALVDLVKHVEFEDKPNHFQNQLKAEKRDIEKEKKLIIAADKTTNHYKMEADDYLELLEKNVHKE